MASAQLSKAGSAGVQTLPEPQLAASQVCSTGQLSSAGEKQDSPFAQSPSSRHWPDGKPPVSPPPPEPVQAPTRANANHQPNHRIASLP